MGGLLDLNIQRCKNCSKEFKWKTIIKSLWFGYKPIECVNCKTKHYLVLTYRIIISTGIVLPVFFSHFLSSLLKTYPLRISFYLVWVAIVICIAPFFSRYHLED